MFGFRGGWVGQHKSERCSFEGVAGCVSFQPNIVRLGKTAHKNGRPLNTVQFGFDWTWSQVDYHSYAELVEKSG